MLIGGEEITDISAQPLKKLWALPEPECLKKRRKKRTTCYLTHNIVRTAGYNPSSGIKHFKWKAPYSPSVGKLDPSLDPGPKGTQRKCPHSVCSGTTLNVIIWAMYAREKIRIIQGRDVTSWALSAKNHVTPIMIPRSRPTSSPLMIPGPKTVRVKSAQHESRLGLHKSALTALPENTVRALFNMRRLLSKDLTRQISRRDEPFHFEQCNLLECKQVLNALTDILQIIPLSQCLRPCTGRRRRE